jgi:hypothetical protein
VHAVQAAVEMPGVSLRLRGAGDQDAEKRKPSEFQGTHR